MKCEATKEAGKWLPCKFALGAEEDLWDLTLRNTSSRGRTGMHKSEDDAPLLCGNRLAGVTVASIVGGSVGCDRHSVALVGVNL